MKQLEGALLRLVALGVKTLECLLARSVLLLADDATLLGLHQILLGQATGSVLGGAVVNLGLGAHSDHLSTNHRVVVAILTSGVHFLYFYRRNKSIWVHEKLKFGRTGRNAPKMTTENKYTLKEIYELLGAALILLQDKHITVSETDREDEDAKEIKQRVSLSDYIVRAVGDELIDRWGETDESIANALDDTRMEFGTIAYAKISKCLAIYNDIR
jgi:hypothetical protein